MRLIDKLPFIKPSEDRYTLLPPSVLELPFTGKKEKVALSFSFGNNFYRGLPYGGKEGKKFSPFEKIYETEEVDLDTLLIDLGQEIKKLEEQEGINLKKTRFGTYIPTSYGIARLYTFPKTLSKGELRNTIDLYIQNEIAEVFSDKEVVYSYDFLETKKDEPYKVLVAIVEREIVQKLLAFAKGLEITLDVISYEPVCLLNLGFKEKLPVPFTIIYTDVNKILIFSYQKDRITYEVFPYLFSTDQNMEDVLNLLIWDIRNYIVLNDLTNLYLSGLVLEYEELTEYFLEKLPIFGIVSIDDYLNRYILNYTLAERLINV